MNIVIDHPRSGVVYNFGPICLSVYLSHDNFRKPWRRVKFVYESDWSKKGRNFLFPQCKTSIDNNFGSVKPRALKFACSMGFSPMADRMVWLRVMHTFAGCKKLLKTLTYQVYFRIYVISSGNTGEVRIWMSWGQGQGHRSKKGRKSLFPQCKASIGNNSASIKAMRFACSMGFRLWLIEWCYHHLCHVTVGDHT